MESLVRLMAFFATDALEVNVPIAGGTRSVEKRSAV